MEQHAVKMYHKPSESNYRSVQTTNVNGRILDELYKDINKIMDHRLEKLEHPRIAQRGTGERNGKGG